mmetsp:Transcript_65375/g.165655  ORF Transcript_65375/g.165655 Transcript_65375/m.165655 type:complete len:230 (+) Transcript_65375:1821-2510(+)
MSGDVARAGRAREGARQRGARQRGRRGAGLRWRRRRRRFWCLRGRQLRGRQQWRGQVWPQCRRRHARQLCPGGSLRRQRRLLGCEVCRLVPGLGVREGALHGRRACRLRRRAPRARRAAEAAVPRGGAPMLGRALRARGGALRGVRVRRARERESVRGEVACRGASPDPRQGPGLARGGRRAEGRACAGRPRASAGFPRAHHPLRQSVRRAPQRQGRKVSSRLCEQQWQ